MMFNLCLAVLLVAMVSADLSVIEKNLPTARMRCPGTDLSDLSKVPKGCIDVLYGSFGDCFMADMILEKNDCINRIGQKEYNNLIKIQNEIDAFYGVSNK